MYAKQLIRFWCDRTHHASENFSAIINSWTNWCGRHQISSPCLFSGRGIALLFFIVRKLDIYERCKTVLIFVALNWAETGPVNMLWNRFLTAHNTLGCSHSGGALNCNWSSPFQGIECGGLLTFCAFICLNDLGIAILSVVYDGKFWTDRFELDTVSCVNCYATAHDDAIVDFWALIFARKSSAFPSVFW